MLVPNTVKKEESKVLSKSVADFYANGGVKVVVKTKKKKIKLVISRIHRAYNSGNYATHDFTPKVEYSTGIRGMNKRT